MLFEVQLSNVWFGCFWARLKFTSQQCTLQERKFFARSQFHLRRRIKPCPQENSRRAPSPLFNNSPFRFTLFTLFLMVKVKLCCQVRRFRIFDCSFCTSIARSRRSASSINNINVCDRTTDSAVRLPVRLDYPNSELTHFGRKILSRLE